VEQVFAKESLQAFNNRFSNSSRSIMKPRAQFKQPNGNYPTLRT